MKKHNNILKVAMWIVPVIILLLAIIFPNQGWAYLVNLLLTFVELSILVFNFKDKHNANKVILAVILCFMLLTWLIPSAAMMSGEYAEQGRIRMGLFDLVNYPVTSVSYFGYIAFYVLSIGVFYGVLNKIPAYRVFLDRIVKAVKGTEKFVLFIIMLLLAVLTSIGGMQIALLCLFPMLVSLILLMGFDKIVAALTLVGSTMVGIAGSTYGYANVEGIISFLDVNITAEIITKIVILVLGLVLLFANTMFYIKKQGNNKGVVKEIKKKEIKVEKSAEKSKSKKSSSKKDTKAAVKEEEVVIVKEQPKTKDENTDLVPASVKSKHNIWPFIVGFVLLFIITVLAFISWTDGFGVKAFDDATKAVVDFQLFGFPIFSSLFGTFNAFGSWSIIDLTLVLLVIALLLVIIYKVKFEEVLDGAYEGIKKALPIGIVVILIYTCLVITTYHPFQLEVYKALLSPFKKFNIGVALVTSLTSVLAGIFNSDPAYAFQSVLPYLTTVITDAASYPAIGVLFQATYGFTMLFAPTSLILMTVLSYLNINYAKWLKTVWKFLLEFLAVLLVIIVIIVLL